MRGKKTYEEPENDNKALHGGATEDVTERRILVESEERFRNMFEHHNAVMLLIEPDSGAIVEANKAAVAYYGYPRERLCAMRIQDINQLPPAEVAAERQKAAADQRNHFTFRHRLFNGEVRWVDVYSSPFETKGRTLLFSVIHDITERKLAENSLQKSIERLDIISSTASGLLLSSEPQKIVETLCRRVMEHLECHIFFNFLVDDEMNCLRLNAYAGIPAEKAREIQLLDYGVSMCGRTARDVCRIVAENIPATGDVRTDLVGLLGVTAYACHPLLSQGRVIGTLSFGSKSRVAFTEDELELMKAISDKVANAIERSYLLREAEKRGKVLETSVEERTDELARAYERLEMEMAERAKVEDQLRHSQKMEAVGTLAGGIAHDFNNILAAIIGFAEMIEEDLPSESPSIRHAQKILSAAFRGRDLVKQILAFSRKAEYGRQPVSVSSVIGETVELLRASLPSTIEIISDITAASDTIIGSPVEIQQVLMNLATNAALSMRETGGILHVSLTDSVFVPDSAVLEMDALSQDYLELIVADTGSGMSAEEMKRIFEPFYTTRAVGEGTGMGLSVVYGIVKSLHGGISVESEPGVGSSFRVFFPKVTTDVRSRALRHQEGAGGAGQILFVDDEELLAEWGQAMLERMGYDVTALTDSMEALDVFLASPSQFDLVITDQTMPGITGLNLAQEFLRVRPDIPVILCTGHSDTVSPERAKKMGIKEFLMKPIGRRGLVEAIGRAMNSD
jgi:PAS domain S-box-containing protein